MYHVALLLLYIGVAWYRKMYADIPSFVTSPVGNVHFHNTAKMALICYLHLSTVYFSFYTVFIILRAAVRAPVSLAVLLGFTCLVAFVYIYEQIND